MNFATRIALSALLAAGLLGASAAARPADEPSQKPVQKPNFDLSEAQMRRFLSGQRLILQSPEAIRIANNWRAGRASISIQKPAALHAKPASYRCYGEGEKCAAFDEDGKYLFAVAGHTDDAKDSNVLIRNTPANLTDARGHLGRGR